MAFVQCAVRAARTACVLRGHGPSSNVKTTSPSRRKSCDLKCSKPKPGPPFVSTSTTRETPIAFGFAHAAPAGSVLGTAAGAAAEVEPGFCAVAASVESKKHVK